MPKLSKCDAAVLLAQALDTACGRASRSDVTMLSAGPTARLRWRWIPLDAAARRQDPRDVPRQRIAPPTSTGDGRPRGRGRARAGVTIGAMIAYAGKAAQSAQLAASVRSTSAALFVHKRLAC